MNKPAETYLTNFVCRLESCQPNPRKISPNDFLEWARLDFRSGGKRGLGNALANIKRALHCRIDELIRKTHARFTNDWTPILPTTKKLEIIKKIGVEFGAVINVMTIDRNSYEHDYLLPKSRIIESHLDAAHLWLEKSYSSYDFRPLAFVHLPLRGIGSGNNKLSLVTFGKVRQAVFFCDSKKQIVQIGIDGKEVIQPYDSLDLAAMLALEGKYIRRVITEGSAVSLNESLLEDLLNRYRAHLRDQAHP